MTHRLLSPKDVATATTLPLDRVYVGIHAGWIPAVKCGGRFYVAEKSLDTLIEKIASGELKALS